MRISKRRLYFLLISIFVFYLVVQMTSGSTGSSESIILRFIVGIIFVYCIFRGSKERKLINPYWLFSLTPFTLLIYTEKISSFYLQELTVSTWLLGTLNMIGVLVGMSLVHDSRYEHRMEITKKSPYETPDKLKRYAVVFFIIGSMPKIYMLLLNSTMPFDSIISLFVFASIICVMKSKKRKLIWVISITNIAFMMTGSINKTGFLFLVMAYLVSYERYYVTSEKTIKKLLLGAILLGLLIIFVIFPLKDYFASGAVNISGFLNFDPNSTSNYYASRIAWSRSSRLMMPYMYLVSAWNNVQYVIQTQPTTHFAMWTLKPLLGYIQIDNMFENIYTLRPYSSFNTFTFVTVMFKDYGYWGSIIGSIGLGAFIKYMYSSRYKRSYSALDLTCYSMTACATLEMFFSNHFFGLSYPFTIIILMWITNIVTKQKRGNLYQKSMFAS